MATSKKIAAHPTADIDINLLLATIDGLQKANLALTTEVQLLNEKVAYLTDKLFGRSKETLVKDISGQLSLFDTPPMEVEQLEKTPVMTEIKRKNPQRKVGLKAEKIAHLPVSEKHHTLSAEETCCEHCGAQMTAIGATKIREEIQFHQAILDRLVHYQHTYCCKHCERKDVPSFKKAVVPKPLIPNSLGFNSLVAETIRLKFDQKVPAYRQENYWQTMHGLMISRDNIVNWHIKAVHNALDPIAERLRYHLVQEEILHADETTYRVIKSHKADTYYWNFCTAKDCLQPIIFYHHAESRSGEVPKDFLKGFKGYLHCDGYAGYNHVPNVQRVYCFAHARRKFFEAIPKKSTHSEIPAKMAIEMMDVFFTLEREWATLKPDQRLEKRQKFLKPLFINFYEWLSTFEAVPKSKLATAVNYVLKLREGLARIFEDGRLVLTNNLCERITKELVIGRKNWLHSTSLEGARTSGILLSIYQTAKANGLDPTKYFVFLFDNIPNLGALTDTVLDQFLPWSPMAQESCRPTYPIK